jgi:hypothetical protein
LEPFDTGSFSGTLVEAVSITGTQSLDANARDTNDKLIPLPPIINSFVLNYNATRSTLPASFAALAGTYTYALNGATVSLTFATDGNVSGQDSNNCIYAAKVLIASPTVNVYEVAGTQTCVSSVAALTGIASVNPATDSQAASIDLELDDGNAAGFFVLAAKQ